MTSGVRDRSGMPPATGTIVQVMECCWYGVARGHGRQTWAVQRAGADSGQSGIWDSVLTVDGCTQVMGSL
jgi:hypothetical protein